eukprot:gene21354-28290_t
MGDMLYEEVTVHREVFAPDTHASAGAATAIISPDQSTIAVIDPNRCSLTVLSTDLTSESTPQRFSASFSGSGAEAELLSAVCWNEDSTKLVIAGSSGTIYTLNRTGDLITARTGLPTPWVPEGVVGIALVTDDKLLLLSAAANLYVLSLASAMQQPGKAPPLRPIGLQAMHFHARAMAFDWKSHLLAVAGDGDTLPGQTAVTMSLWSYEGGKLQLIKSLGLPKVPSIFTRMLGGGRPDRDTHSSWCLVFSPTSEYVLLAANPGKLHLIDCEGRLVDAAANPSPEEGVAYVPQLAQSVSWWSHAVIGISDSAGSVALTKLPGFANLFGDKMESFAPGSIVCCKSGGGGSHGLFVIEPLSLSSPGLLPPDGARARWQSGPVSEASILENLARMSDRFWAAEECATRVADDDDAQRALIRFGLQEAESQCIQEDVYDDQQNDPQVIAEMRCVIDPDAFKAFRDASLYDAASEWACLGDITSLALLVQRHPLELGPCLLDVVGQLPETLDPRLYSSLLPRIGADAPCSAISHASHGAAPPQMLPLRGIAASQSDGAGSSRRSPDWVENVETKNQLEEDGYVDLLTATEYMIECAYAKECFTAQQVEDFYMQRAILIDQCSGRLDHALTLLEVGVQNGAEIRSEEASWDLTLERFAAMKPNEQLCLLLMNGDEHSLDADITDRYIWHTAHFAAFGTQ